MKHFLLLLICSTTLFAQAPAPPDPPQEREEARFVEIKNLSDREFNRLVGLLVQGFGLRASGDATMRAIFMSGPVTRLQAAEAAIQKVDIPSAVRRANQNIEITTHLLLAKNTDGESSPLPADLDPVAKQLRASFGVKQILLLDTIFTRMREGKPAQTRGSFFWPGDSEQASTYELNFGEAFLAPLGNRYSISTEWANLSIDVPRRGTARIQTSLEMRDGQKIVLGKSNVGKGDGSLIAVLTARVVE